MALILDVATDLERSLNEGNEKRLMDIYGMTTEITLNQLRDGVRDYRQSSDYEALSDETRSLCEAQFDRIDTLSERYLRRN